jgi:1D-myo-inositol-tetrakisphosphate 5-kinase/inositol-polyphosphate multikinase
LASVADFFRHRQRRYTFFASSLLFLYDYDLIGRLSQDEETPIGGDLTNHVRLKLIDFAHVFPADEEREDENFLHGVENLRDIFRQFLITYDDAELE